MGCHEPQYVVNRFWEKMDANDFHGAGKLLADDYILEWPQSGERIRGRENFVLVNEKYPSEGEWSFTIYRSLSDDTEVVTEVTVTDGTKTARAITFSTVIEGEIVFQTEYWPDPFEPANWRSQWVELMETPSGPAGTW